MGQTKYTHTYTHQALRTLVGMAIKDVECSEVNSSSGASSSCFKCRRFSSNMSTVGGGKGSLCVHTLFNGTHMSPCWRAGQKQL